METPQVQATPAQPKKSARTIWAIVCLAGPTALLVFTFVVFAVVNWTLGSVSPGTYADGPIMVRTIINIVLWFLGVIATLSWLPGIIVGIILLATKPAAPRQ